MALEKLLETLIKALNANTAAMTEFMERQDGGAHGGKPPEPSDKDGLEIENEDDEDDGLNFDADDEDEDELSFGDDEDDAKITIEDVLAAFSSYVKGAQNKAESKRVRVTIAPLLKACKVSKVTEIPEKHWEKAIQYGRILTEAYNEGGIEVAEGSVKKAIQAIRGK